MNTYSISALQCFEYCPWGYYLRYIEKRPAQAGYRCICGIAAHKARQYNFAQKQRSGSDLPASVLTDVGRESVRELFLGERVQMQDSEFAGLSVGAARGKAIDETRRLIETDRAVLQPTVMPIATELPLKVRLERQGFGLRMRLDTIDRAGRIIEFKTAQRQWPKGRAEKEYQPAIYALGYYAAQRRAPRAFVYHVVAGGTARAFETHRTERDIKTVLHRFQAMHKAIMAGSFPPAPAGSWRCSPNYCEYYSGCKYAAKQG